MTSYIRVKETKRQGRIAHHHADATVPHIVALLGFSFHAAKIRTFFHISKYLGENFIRSIYIGHKNNESKVAERSRWDRRMGIKASYLPKTMLPTLLFYKAFQHFLHPLQKCVGRPCSKNSIVSLKYDFGSQKGTRVNQSHQPAHLIISAE